MELGDGGVSSLAFLRYYFQSAMGYFLNSEGGGRGRSHDEMLASLENDGSIQDEEMLRAAIGFYIDAFKDRSQVTLDELTLALCARMEEFDSKSAEEWQPYFTAARNILGLGPC
jgi:hypothetical protein